MLDEINKLKYHQRLLLTIALDKEPEQYTYFHFIMNHDLSEEDSKLIFDILHALGDKMEGIYEESKYHESIRTFLGDDPLLSMKTFEDALFHVNIEVDPTYLIKSLRNQYIQVELCNYLLEEKK